MIDCVNHLGSLLTFAPTSLSNAQVTLEVDKEISTHMMHFQIANVRDIGLWLSGYYNGKSSHLLLVEGIEAKLVEDCQSARDEGPERSSRRKK